MKDIVLYCKSYHRDVLRAARLAESVRKHNPSNIPFYISCPSADMPLFKDTIGSGGVIFLTDEEILAANPAIDMTAFNAQPGVFTQQVVKSEFWRLGLCENYLCLDSDSYFIRDCQQSDFLTPSGMPFTVINESLELRMFGAVHHHEKIARNINADCKIIMDIFGRTGRRYDFGPLPVLWSRRVWADLDEKYLKPKGMNFLDAIVLFPSEMRWYGEALLAYHSIELWPVETIFRCYHYEDIYISAKQAGETNETLSQAYLGVCVQSNWDNEFDYGRKKKGLLSRLVRTFKRRVLRRLV
jgi:hypothetical protein